MKHQRVSRVTLTSDFVAACWWWVDILWFITGFWLSLPLICPWIGNYKSAKRNLRLSQSQNLSKTFSSSTTSSVGKYDSKWNYFTHDWMCNRISTPVKYTCTFTLYKYFFRICIDAHQETFEDHEMKIVLYFLFPMLRNWEFCLP